MATSDDRRLIDNESSTTVDKFYGNKGGKDVQIPLADAAAVLAGIYEVYTGSVNDLGNGVVVFRGTDAPIATGIAITKIGSDSGRADAGIQIVAPSMSEGYIYYRILWESAWRQWYKIATTALQLAGSHRTNLQTTGNKVTIDVSQYNQGLLVVGYGGDINAGRKGIVQIITEWKTPTINWIIKPFLWDDYFSNEKIEGNIFSVDCSVDWYYFIMYPLQQIGGATPLSTILHQ